MIFLPPLKNGEKGVGTSLGGLKRGGGGEESRHPLMDFSPIPEETPLLGKRGVGTSFGGGFERGGGGEELDLFRVGKKKKL